jgi:hypothetical protein
MRYSKAKDGPCCSSNMDTEENVREKEDEL